MLCFVCALVTLLFVLNHLLELCMCDDLWMNFSLAALWFLSLHCWPGLNNSVKPKILPIFLLTLSFLKFIYLFYSSTESFSLFINICENVFFSISLFPPLVSQQPLHSESRDVNKLGTSEPSIHINYISDIFIGLQSLSTVPKELLWSGSIACASVYTSKLQTYPLLDSHNSDIVMQLPFHLGSEVCLWKVQMYLSLVRKLSGMHAILNFASRFWSLSDAPCGSTFIPLRASCWRGGIFFIVLIADTRR